MKIKISKLIVMISVVLAPWLAFAGNAVPSDLYEMPVGVTDTDYVHGKLIFKVKDAYRMYCSEQSVNIPGLVEIMSAAGIAGIEKTIKGQQVPKNKADEFGRPTVDLTLIYTVSFDTSRSVVEIANRFLSHPAILYAEPWFISHPFFVPNDPRYNEQDEFHIIQSELAWDITRGDSNVVVGVIDTGTSFIHPEFQGKYLVNYSEPIDGIDNDNDGYIDNYRGWDFGSTGWVECLNSGAEIMEK